MLVDLHHDFLLTFLNSPTLNSNFIKPVRANLFWGAGESVARITRGGRQIFTVDFVLGAPRPNEVRPGLVDRTFPSIPRIANASSPPGRNLRRSYSECYKTS